MAKMSVEQREAYLAKPHVGMLGVEDPGRGPLTVPIWYAYEPGGDLLILTHPKSRKATLIDQAGRFSMGVQTESLPYKYVMVEGPVIERRECDIEQDARPMAHRYLGKSMGDDYIDDGSDGSSVVYIMRPERWYSGDYGA